jgi:hypothetical protein
MEIEKKLIACSILALIIGISSVFPLVFLMSATAKAETLSESWFSINVPYSYWTTSDGPLDYDFGFSFPRDFEMNETNSVSHQHTIVLNLTLNTITTNELVDARVEYYQIIINSDKGPITSHNWFVGTNGNRSFGSNGLLKDLGDFSFMRNDWFDTDKFNMKFGGGGLLRYNWTAGPSILWPEAGSGSATIGGSGTSILVDTIREAETLFITVHRIGWVTFTGNSTIVTLANNEIVDQIQLEKFGDGFLYNNLVPEDELATIDLLRQVPFEELLTP